MEKITAAKFYNLFIENCREDRLFDDKPLMALYTSNTEYTDTVNKKIIKNIVETFDLTPQFEYFRIDVTALLKAFNVRIFQEENTLLERLVAYIKLGTRYLGIRQYFFVNLKCFLSGTELILFYKEAALEHVGLFLLENTVREKIDGEKIVIVDKDLCEIVV